MGSEKCSLVFFFFFRFLGISSLFSSFLLGQEQTTAIYCKNGELHTDPPHRKPRSELPEVSSFAWNQKRFGTIRSGEVPTSNFEVH